MRARAAAARRPARGAACHSCGAPGALREFPAFPAFRLVTSDCRPWENRARLAACRACGLVQKVMDGARKEDLRSIYQGYALYRQGGGAEQRFFQARGGISCQRSLWLMEKLVRREKLGARGKLLDVGCGNGDLIASFRTLRPRWALAGHEMDGRARARALRAGAGRFYAGALEEVPDRFDLITLMHVLEHIPRPAAALSVLREKLSPGGRLFIQCPSSRRNPFDLLVADHLSHFTPAALSAVAAAAGLSVPFRSEAWAQKEISLVAAGRGTARRGPPPADDAGWAAGALSWLARVRGAARKTAAGGAVGVFGTAIAGVWLFSELDGAPAFFVDEDPARAGRTFLGRPVLAPGKCPRGVPVVMPLLPRVAAAVKRRLGAAADAFRPPPAEGFPS